MILNYVFEDAVCTLCDGDGSVINSHYHCDLEYDYKHDITVDDIVGYYLGSNCNKGDYYKGFKAAIERLVEDNLFDPYSFEEEFEDDEDFVDWLKDKYYDAAYEQCIDEGEDVIW